MVDLKKSSLGEWVGGVLSKATGFFAIAYGAFVLFFSQTPTGQSSPESFVSVPGIDIAHADVPVGGGGGSDCGGDSS